MAQGMPLLLQICNIAADKSRHPTRYREKARLALPVSGYRAVWYILLCLGPLCDVLKLVPVSYYLAGFQLATSQGSYGMTFTKKMV